MENTAKESNHFVSQSPITTLSKYWMSRVNSQFSYISDCDIDVSSATAIASVLQSTKTIYQINLSSNPLGEAGGDLIATALKSNQTLRTLNLASKNVFGLNF